jgi:hypothetical protein
MGVLVAGLRATEAAQPGPPEFRQLPALASVRTAVSTAHVSLDRIAPPLDRRSLRLGDTVTALVSLTDGAKLQQWVIELKAVEPTSKEKQDKSQPMVFYSSTGHELRFDSERAALAIRTLGPLTNAEAGRKVASLPAVKQARAAVDADFLALGLDRQPALGERMKKMEREHPEIPHGNLEIGMQPFPAETIARSRQEVGAAGISEADERAMIGSIVALIQFFQVASRTPGLQDVVMSVVDLPWWAIIRAGGKITGFNIGPAGPNRALDAAAWGLAKDATVWGVPYSLQLNGKTALLFQLAVTDPAAPLLPCAGIVGLAAGRPDGKGPVMTLQIVSAHGADEAPTATEKTP